MNLRAEPVALAALLSVVASAGVSGCAATRAKDASLPAEVAAAMRAQTAELIVPIVEADPEIQHSWSLRRENVACVAETFAWEPPDETNVAAIRTVYAHVLCVAVIPGRDFDKSPGLSSPMAVDLSTHQVQGPTEAGDGYVANLRRIFPRHLWTAAGQGLRDPEGAQLRLRQKVGRMVSPSPS